MPIDYTLSFLFHFLHQHQLTKSLIPEPMASMGELSGLEKKAYDNEDEFTPNAIVFTGKALSQKDKEIELFIQGYNKGVEDIQNDDIIARETLIETLKLNPEIKDKILLPTYQKARIHDESYMNKVMDWIEKSQDIELDVTYQNLFEGKYVE